MPSDKSTSARILQFVGRVRHWWGEKPEPPPIIKEQPGGYALFMDEDEREVLYAKPWPYTGCPSDDRTHSSTWMIEGRRFIPSRRDKDGNWRFRRCGH